MVVKLLFGFYEISAKLVFGLKENSRQIIIWALWKIVAKLLFGLKKNSYQIIIWALWNKCQISI